MKKSFKKLTAVILTVSIVFSLFIPSIGAYALTDTYKNNSSFSRKLLAVRDEAINGLVRAINWFYPCKWEWTKDYKSENMYDGTGEFTSVPSRKWYVGYDNSSIQDGKELDGKHYVGGSISASKLATAIQDDQKVRTVALSTDNGIVVYAVIDCFGLANPYVREIRSRLSAFAKEKNIVSINISSLHQHSCVDTFGMNGDIFKVLFLNWMLNLAGKKLYNGINDDFMENLMNVTVNSVKDAVNNMTSGKLYYGNTDITKYIHDKRDPQIYDKNFNRFRFVPDDDGREIWILNAPIHCVGNGAAQTTVTGDYPYYMEKEINEKANADVLYILGAQLAITGEYESFWDEVEDMPRLEQLQVFGKKLAEAAISINNDKEVEPILNVAYNEIKLKVSNQLLLLAGRGGMLTNKVVRNNIFGTDVLLVTEIGYMELGNDYSVAMIPGELAPELAFGGCYKADESWDGKDFPYPPMNEKVGDRQLIVFGLTNDQIGYILADNDYVALFAENEEFISLGKTTGSSVVKEFLSLVDEVKK
ncbi:MAG: hypothetical protein K6F09_08415 [Clostridiales bacterium]|nr:hypothetical protein [Clostridiales bacterium]